METIKYIICFLCEKHHRKVFDRWYNQDVVITLRGKIDCFILDLIQRFIPDYRRYLRANQPNYMRYTPYWN